MLNNNHCICGIDIGTQTIKVLAAKPKEGEGLEIVSQISQEVEGVRRGVIISPEIISDVLQGILFRLKEERGQKISSVYVNINGSHLFTQLSRGLISVSRADHNISEEDIQRVLQAAEAISLPSNKEIFDSVSQEFVIDGEGGIKEALGLRGVRLEAEVLVLGGFAPYLRNLNEAILGSDIQISDRIPSCIAAARACLTDKQKESGAAVVDIGAGTTGLAVFQEKDLVHLTVLPMGSANITSDIAIGLKTDIDLAERIKIEYGTCFCSRLSKREKIENAEGENLLFSPKQVTDIINLRVLEIFREIYKELKKISREKSLPSGVVITGGGSKLPRILELAKRELKLPVRLGKPQGISGLGDPLWSVCSGLVLHGADLEENESGGISQVKDWAGRFKKIFKAFIP